MARKHSGATALVSALGALGYRGRKPAPAALRWAFEDEETRGVLEWLAAKELSSQVLSAHEQQQYEELELLGRAIEDEGALAEALHCAALEAPGDSATGSEAAAACDDPLNVGRDFRRDEAAALTEELAAVRRQRAELSRQREMLRSQAEAVRRREAVADARHRAASRRLAEAQAAVSAAGRAVEGVLDELAADGADLQSLYGYVHGRGSGGFLLSSMPVHRYATADLAYSTELDRFRAKQFVGGAAKLGSEAEATPATVQEALRPHSIEGKAGGLLAGSEQSEWEAMQKELTRLQNAFEVGEQQRILALAEQAAAEAELVAWERGPSVLGSDDDIEAQAQQVALKAQYTKLSVDLPELLKKIAANQGMHILRADYERKLLRQRYYFERKKAFLHYMLQQAAWHKTLELCLAIEAQGTARLHSLLVSTDERLSDTVTASTLRCATYRQLQHAPVPVARRLTLRGSDTLLQRVWGALCQARDALQTAARSEGAEPRPPEPSPRALGSPIRTEYVEVVKLMELFAALREAEARGILAASTSTRQAQRHTLAALCDAGRQLSGLLFPEASAVTAVMTPSGVQDALRSLKSVSNSFNEMVVELGNQYAAKAEQIKRQGDAGAVARAVLPLFHADPCRLAAEAHRMEERAGWGV